MIKILFLIENLNEGGAEKVLRNLVNHMDQTKFDIMVQTVWPCDSSKYLVQGVHYKSMYSIRNERNVLRYRAEAEMGLAYRLHVKDDYDIECAFLEMGPTKVMSASTNKKAKKLAWVHCDLSKKVGNIDKYVAKAGKQYQKFDEIICVSENVQESFESIFGKSFTTRVLYNVVEDDLVRKKAEEDLPLGLTKRRFTLASLGRLTNQKGYDTLLRAHLRLIREGYEHDLWIAGDGEDRPMLEQYIANHKLADSVKLLGFQDNPYPVLAAADLLVCSSRYEGLSTFVTEGLILGKPIVSTDCTGMRELLGKSKYGLITEITEESLYKGIKRLMQNDEERDEFTQKAAVRGKDFSREELVETIETYFTKVLGK